MNKNKLFFRFDIVLSILLLIAIFSLPASESSPATQAQIWGRIHAISGTLMLIIAAIHLALHWDWIKAVVLRRTLPRAKAVRSKRTTDLWLFTIAVPCAIAGIIVWFLPGIFPALLSPALNAWRDVHIWSGVAMFIVMVMHLAQHWKWITAQFRTRQHKTSPQPAAAAAQPVEGK